MTHIKNLGRKCHLNLRAKTYATPCMWLQEKWWKILKFFLSCHFVFHVEDKNIISFLLYLFSVNKSFYKTSVFEHAPTYAPILYTASKKVGLIIIWPSMISLITKSNRKWSDFFPVNQISQMVVYRLYEVPHLVRSDFEIHV